MTEPAAVSFSVSVEGPESNGPDFDLGPYSAAEAEVVRERLERTLTAADPDFVVTVGGALSTDTTEVDIFEYFDVLDFMDPASARASRER